MQLRQEPPPVYVRLLVTVLLLCISVLLLLLRIATAYLKRIRKSNPAKRKKLLQRLGLLDVDAKEGRGTRIIAFFHPYW